MAYDRSYLVGRVQDRIGDDDAELTNKIIDALNDVQDELCNTYKFRFQETSSNVSLTATNHSVAKPAACQQIIGLRRTAPLTPTNYRKNMTRDFVPYQTFRDMYPVIDASIDEDGAAYKWTEFGNNLIFNKVADQTYTYAVDFLQAPTRMSADGSTPTIPQEFEEIYVLGAVMRLMKSEDDYQPKAEEEKDYNKLVRALVQRYGRGTEPLAPKRMPSAFRR